MLRDLPDSENGSDERVPISSTSFTIDLNGFTLSGGNLTISAGYTGTVTIMNSKAGGVFLRQPVLQGSEATLIMGEGLGGSDQVSSIMQCSGTLKSITERIASCRSRPLTRRQRSFTAEAFGK